MCEQCKDGIDEELLLLCSGELCGGVACPAAFHTYCLRPALGGVPEGDWFCGPCQARTLVFADAGKEEECSVTVLKKGEEWHATGSC